MPNHPLWRLVRLVGNVVAATGVAIAVLGLCAAGFGRLPALGRVLDPGRGAWTSAAGGLLPAPQTLKLPGISGGAIVTFDRHGIASIDAASEADAMVTLGYTQASLRLAQMDTERRLAEGTLAQLVGPSAVASDEFELRLGLLRTATREWAEMPKTSVAARMLEAYAIGVNDYLTQVRENKRWPALFSLAGVYPADWTPVDSLAIQGDLTQELDYTTTPLDYALLARSLGVTRTMRWFPVLPENKQYPYDPGPYRPARLAPITTAMTPAPVVRRAVVRRAVVRHAVVRHAVVRRAVVRRAVVRRAVVRRAVVRRAVVRRAVVRRAVVRHAVVRHAVVRHAVVGHAVVGHTVVGPTVVGHGPAASALGDRPAATSAAVDRAAAAMLSAISALPAGQIHGYPDSNAWVANGPKVAGGGSMLAGDPHLGQTLPSIWFEVALAAPGYDVSGVSVPGLPGVLIGRNRHIAWSLTDTQNQATLFYLEKTSKAHPGQYFWRGRWRTMRRQRYTIYVRGGAPRQLTVDLTVHGPVMTQAGQTVSVDWMGNVPSPDVAALQQISTASDFRQFRAALAGWRAPTQTFVYADDHGNIGAISAGYYPIVRHGLPWFPMTGTGADDVAGVIPYSAVPMSYDPSSHVIATASQRPVTAAYPYYIGTTANFFDPGYRAGREYAFLTHRANLTMGGFAALQTSQTDGLAVRLLGSIVRTLRGGSLSPMEQQALALLQGWNDSMDQNSAAAAIWWNLWSDYLDATFEPWWRAARVPVGLDGPGLAVSPGQSSLDEVLEHWSLSDPGNAAFSPPGAPAGTAVTVLRVAFATAVGQLHASLGGGPSSWAWGRLHSRQVPSPAQVPGLGYGPKPAGGDPWTVDTADGLPVATAGPSWRMIVRWPGSRHSNAVAWGIYPGGQSENPASPWYQNLIADWWNDSYLPMPSPGAATSAVGVRWELEP